ncbi:MAG: type VI secretion system baseplate subunit TssK [Pyrinomonadaceae bacterium]|nr:type VI secretion system baseplate subunit TssK [Pyrinomonadaceae bacterium]MCX7639079.1 type VI secretion system baseplate subunit TssK [Pyrinomonadaceae bacterium]MDW8303700.1 type VI secretion system baseplate subunit TssK [Acidobacteriota bacterium]
MSRYRKIVWNEGMLLTPHHFQQWDNYHEDLLNSRINSLFAFNYGVLDLQLNHEAIANGNFQIISCRAVLPDGLMVNIPDTDPEPSLRPIAEHFRTEQESLGAYLAIPAHRFGSANFQANGAPENVNVRFLQEGVLVKDETTGTNEQPIAFAKPNLRIIFEDELRDGFTSIKIAELVRTATGQFKVSENYIPPVLSVSASPWLVNMLRQLVEILITKSSTLGEQRRQSRSSLADFTTSDVAIFWLLHTVNSAIPILLHYFNSPLVHPEKLYLKMSELVGELMTFSIDLHPKNIVRYDHDDLYYTFSNLSAQLRDLLETVIPTRCVPIPLEKISATTYVGRVEDDRLLNEAEFYLAINANMPASRIIEEVPRILKIASRDTIDTVVGLALPGVPLIYRETPPASIPARMGFKYFQLDTSGAYWEGIKGSKVLAVYVPEKVPDEKLEMYAIKP